MMPPQFRKKARPPIKSNKKKKGKPVNKAARNAAIKKRLAQLQGSVPEGKGPDSADSARRAFTANFRKGGK